MKTENLKAERIDKWIPLANQDFVFGQKYMGEFHMGCEWVKSIISFKGDTEYLNFGDIPFSNIDQNNFFLQTKEGNHIIVQWLFHKVHSHLTPVIFDLINKSYKIVDPTRILQPIKIWQIDNKLYAEFMETIWVDSQRHEKLVSFEIEKDFKDIGSFYNLDPTDLRVAIYKWDNKELTIEIK